MGFDFDVDAEGIMECNSGRFNEAILDLQVLPSPKEAPRVA